MSVIDAWISFAIDTKINTHPYGYWCVIIMRSNWSALPSCHDKGIIVYLDWLQMHCSGQCAQFEQHCRRQIHYHRIGISICLPSSSTIIAMNYHRSFVALVLSYARKDLFRSAILSQFRYVIHCISHIVLCHIEQFDSLSSYSYVYSYIGTG